MQAGSSISSYQGTLATVTLGSKVSSQRDGMGCPAFRESVAWHSRPLIIMEMEGDGIQGPPVSSGDGRATATLCECVWDRPVRPNPNLPPAGHAAKAAGPSAVCLSLVLKSSC